MLFFENSIMKATLITIHFLFGVVHLWCQKPQDQHEYYVYSGFRLLHYPTCSECYFEPSEWTVPNHSIAHFVGLMMKRSHGFTASLEYGSYRRQSYSNGVNVNESIAIYTEILHHTQTRYINLSLGHTFGSDRLRFSLLSGFDYMFSRKIYQEQIQSAFQNTPRPNINKFPDKPADSVARSYTNQFNPSFSRSGMLIQIGASLRYFFWNNFSASLTAELALWPRSLDDHVYEPVRTDAYRFALAYNFSSKEQTQKTNE
jgi:hypothetical protein